MSEAVFWACVALIGYVYVGYPLAIRVLALFRKPSGQPVATECPPVSLIIAAYNEERVLAAKLANSLALDYPRDSLDIIVASDGSSDGTDAIAAGFAPRGVRVVRVEGRQGKTAAQNAAAAQARGEILVFSDANAIYEPDALRRLVARFADPSVGCVEGRRADVSASGSATAQYELTYRDWESRIKMWESKVLSCVGATGPIYAVRRALYVPLDPVMISDFMEPLLVMSRHGKRQVFEPAAISREDVHGEMRDEFHRKVRIITRCLNSLRMAPEVLNPLRHGWFAMQVLSHRLLRWLVPVFAVGAFAANVFLLPSAFYRVTLLLQVSFLLVAGIGAALDRLNVGPAFLRLPHYFCAANLAALDALGNCLLRRNIVTWRPVRA
jgi:cellulose synthase/poly-beta-1,6-N-acetylglucosamine synthase-like glycosyltransferase